MAEHIGSKSHVQCKTYYNTFNKKLRFDDLHEKGAEEDASYSENDEKGRDKEEREDREREKEEREREREKARRTKEKKEKKERERRERDNEEGEEYVESGKEDRGKESEKDKDDAEEHEHEAEKEKRRGKKKQKEEPSEDSPAAAWSVTEKQEFIKFLAQYPSTTVHFAYTTFTHIFQIWQKLESHCVPRRYQNTIADQNLLR